MGGTDDPENIEFLTPEQHAEAHRKLYEEHGKIEDYLAWRGLDGFIGKEEIIEELMRQNGKKLGERMMKERKGIFDPEKQKTEKYKKGLTNGGRTVGRMMAKSGHCQTVCHLGGGKNLGKNSWFNSKTGKETQSFESPGDDWELGINMDRVDLEFLRKNSSNRKGSFWITNDETGETRMVKDEEEIPTGFRVGRNIKKKNTLDVHNVPSYLNMKKSPSLILFYLI
jgi:hypothetical protein